MYILTIALMTFKRPDNALSVIPQISDLCLKRSDINFIVISECELDKPTWSLLEGISSKYNFKLIDGESNGFNGAFCKSIINSQGKYCIHMSDEDDLNLANINKLIDFLYSVSPDVVVSNYQVMRSKKPIKVRKNITRKISQFEYFHLYHNPGMIWHVNNSKFVIKLLSNSWSINFPNLYKYYPHLLIILYFFRNNNSYFLNQYLLTQSRFSIDHHPLTSYGRYSHFVSRIIQFFEIENYLLFLDKYHCLDAFSYNNLITYHKKSFFSYFITHYSLSGLNKEISFSKGFVFNLLPYFFLRKNYFRIKNFFSKLFH